MPIASPEVDVQTEENKFKIYSDESRHPVEIRTEYLPKIKPGAYMGLGDG
jgi:hypothetical protein